MSYVLFGAKTAWSRFKNLIHQALPTTIDILQKDLKSSREGYRRPVTIQLIQGMLSRYPCLS